MSYEHITKRLENLASLKTISDDEVNAQEQERVKREFDNTAYFRLSIIPKRYLGCTFDSFVTDKPSIVDYLKTGGSAILYGNNGTGKTHLAFASIRHQVEQGCNAKYVLAADFFTMIKRSYGDGNNEYMKFYGCDYLVIDEVDKRFGTQTEFIALYQLINHRYNSMLPTVLITNSGKDELIDVIGVSSFDRIVEDGKLIHMDGKNYRRS